MVAKAFLLQECKNLRALLNRSLRNEYGPVGSEEFYEECSTRLQFLETEIKAQADTDVVPLGGYSIILNELSKLIFRLERSSVGEYSWAFVHELKSIANVICTERTMAGDNTPNPIYVMADGGLDAYQIYPEQRRPHFTQRRLLTIVFPKSLKQFVLLHSILGHELGHAVWRCSDHQKEIKANVEVHLKEGIFASAADTAAHLFGAAAPQLVKEFIQYYHVTTATIFNGYADWDAWLEEVLCDLFGLITFGPSFFAAECEMLATLGFGGGAFDPGHPVGSWRLNCLFKAANALQFNQPPPQGHFVESYHNNFWTYWSGFNNADPWHDAFSADQIQRAVAGLQGLLARFPPTVHPPIDFDLLSDLIKKLVNRVPPVGYSLSADGKPELKHVDFRHILCAGWYVRCSHPDMPVEIINQLCEHAIMQQRAVKLAMA